MRTTLFGAALAISLAACGATPGDRTAAGTPAVTTNANASAAPTSEPSATATVAVNAPPAPKRAKVRFEANGEDFGAPLVDALVGGQPTTLMLDTGATHHVVASWVAAEVGPTRDSAIQGLDHAGQSVALKELPNGEITISGWGPIGAGSPLVAALPIEFQKSGVGGLLAVQALVGEGRAVTLDMRTGALTEGPEGEAMAAVEKLGGAAITGSIRTCANGASLPFVRVTIGGGEIDAQLDTGATNTTVRAASPAGVKLKPLAKTASTAFAASGMFTVPSVKGAHVQVGALDVETTIDLVKRDPRPDCPNDAFVGIDVLRRCALVFGKKTLAGRCEPVGGEKTKSP
ncbi:MAG: aspartyl protease family protein [Polyangiaceae bacterium]